MPVSKFKIMRNINEVRHLYKVKDIVDQHIHKSCGFCGWEFGKGDDILVADFCYHMVDKHREELTFMEIRRYKEFNNRYAPSEKVCPLREDEDQKDQDSSEDCQQQNPNDQEN